MWKFIGAALAVAASSFAPNAMAEFRDVLASPSARSPKAQFSLQNGLTIAVKPVYKNYVNMHIQVAKRQEESGQLDLLDSAEEAAMIMRAEQAIAGMQRTEATQ